VARTAEVVFVGDAKSLIKAAQDAARATDAAAAKIAEGTGKISESYGKTVLASERVGATAAQQAARTGVSMAEQQAAAERASGRIVASQDAITVAAKTAGPEAAHQAAALGASLAEQEGAYARAATSAARFAAEQQATAAKTASANKEAAAASEAAVARAAKAHDKAVASAKKSNEAFGKWGTVTAAVVIGGSAKMAVSLETAATAIAKAGGASTEQGRKIAEAFKGLSGLEYSGAKVGEAFATIAGEMRTVEGRALGLSKATEVMTAALDLTDATGGDLTKTTEQLGKVMLTFGVHANHAAGASDVLFNASKQTGTSVEEVTKVIDRMHGRLGALAPSLSETGGLMEELAKHGIVGRQSLATLNGVFATLVGGSKNTKTAIKELGLTVFDQNGHFVGLRKVIEQLQPTLAKYNQQTQLEYTRALFGAGANKQLLEVIHQGPAAYDAATKAVRRHGTAAEAAAREHQTLEGKLKIARAGAENLGATLGEALIPALVKVVGALTDGAKWLKEHGTAAKALAIVVGSVLGAAMVDFAVVKVAKFVGGLQTMADGLKALAIKFGLIPSAAEGAAVKTAAAQYALAGNVAAADTRIGAANAAASKSFMAMLGPIGIATAAVVAFNEMLPSGSKIENLLGGNQPGEAGRESSEGMKYGRRWDQQQASDTEGGIMAYFMSKGLNAAQAAGIVGNIRQESNLNPKAPGGGFFQDIGPRAASGKGSAQQQLEAAWDELTSAYSSVLTKLKKAHSPGEAARIFSEGFEKPTKPMLSNRERYAAQAYGTHSHHLTAQQKHTAAMEHHTRALEGKGTLPSIEALQKKEHEAHKKAPDLSSQIDRWAEHSVGKFAETWGNNTGPELDALQKEFHTHAAAWCAEFATTAAMMGGANKAVRTASVATVREWAEQGSHGYHRGVSRTPHVGDLMMLGNEHVGFVQSVHGDKVTTIEGNTSGGKVEVEHRSASEGTYASPIYHDLKTGKVLLDKQSKAYEEAVKRAEKLLLTGGQRTMLHSHVQAAGEAHAAASMWSEAAGNVGAFLQARQARWALQKPDLTTGEGQKAAHDRDEQAVLTAQTQKKYYEREVKALQKEASEWGKIRDSYRKFARHAKGRGAKKEALHKAAEFDAKVKQAEHEARELGGTIAATETAIIEAENQRDVVLPEEIAQAAKDAAAKDAEGQGADLSAYQADNAKVDLEVRAGLKSEAEGKAAKEANAKKALAGGYGELSEEGILQVKGDLKEFSAALTSATDALTAHTEALKDATKVLAEFNMAGTQIARVESGTWAKALADVVSGQIGGVNVPGRRRTPGAGRAATY
jgi:TP901 family phage tail tape measure protein